MGYVSELNIYKQTQNVDDDNDDEQMMLKDDNSHVFMPKI